MTEILVTFDKIINHVSSSTAITYTHGYQRNQLKIPKSFQVPSSNISEVQSFEILAEFLRKNHGMSVIIFIGADEDGMGK